jgi:hypothetical protein
VKEIHPLTAYIPERADQGALETDIAQNGVHESVILYEGKVIEGRVRYRACLDIGVQPQFKDLVLITDNEPIDWIVRRHIEQHDPSELDRIKIAASVIDFYKEMRGNTEVKLSDAVGVSIRKMRAIRWLKEAGKLDPVLRGEIDILDAGRAAGFVAEKRGVALGRNYGHGDRFDDATQPLRRYLTSWARKGYEFRHLNPKEATRRLIVIDRLMEDLGHARVDLERRSHAATLSAPPERKERR